MNFETKREKVMKLMLIAKDRGDWYEATMIQFFLEKVDLAAKVDVRHANGILDRLLKSDYLKELIEGNKNNANP